MNKKIVCFLDLLGYKNHTRENIEGTLQLLGNYNEILEVYLTGKRNYHPELYEDFDRQYKVSLDSFEYFLPFSDSIFIVANDSDRFIEQVSGFLLSCFSIAAKKYISQYDKANPTYIENTLNNMPIYYYPMLFQGGVTFNEVKIFEINSIINYRLSKTVNLGDRAVINACELHKTDKGPRLFCDMDFINILSESSKKYIATGSDNKFEILWPAFQYKMEKYFTKQRFLAIFYPSLNLWKVHKHEDCSDHYFNLLKLIIVSALNYIDNTCYSDNKKENIKIVSNVIIDEGIENEFGTLTETYL